MENTNIKLPPSKILYVTVANCDFNRAKEIAEKYRNIELRLDLLSWKTPQTIAELVHIADKVIITEDHIHIYSIPRKNVIFDVPLSAIPFRPSPGGRYQLSMHLNSTPHFKILLLRNILKHQLNLKKFEYIKITKNIRNQPDIDDFFTLFKTDFWKKLVLVPIGEKYSQERIRSLKLGSPYMFCHVDEPVSAGQLHYDEMLPYLTNPTPDSEE